MKAEAVVQVEARAADAGFLFCAGKYTVLSVVVGQDFHHFFFAQTVYAEIVHQAAATAVAVGIIGRKLSAFGAPVPDIVVGVRFGGRQIHAAALVAGGIGFDAPQVGLQVYPAAVFGLPVPAEFVGVGADIGIDTLHLRRQCFGAVAGIVFFHIHHIGGMEGVDFAKAHVGAHILPAKFMAAGQMPVVFQQQGFGFGVAVEHFHAGMVDLGHIGHEGGRVFAVEIAAALVVAFLQVVYRIVQVAFRTFAPGEVVAFVAVAVGGQAV